MSGVVMMKKYLGKSGVILMALAVITVTSQAEDENVIEYRQHIMASMNAQALILGKIVSTAIPNDQVIEHLETIAILSETSLKSFEAEVPGGESSPDIWSNWEDYTQLMNEFSNNAKGAAASAHVNGKETALNSILNVLTCKQCHDKYRME
jgi:cytochrome c556